ncbi:MAG: TetR/AcrR family transcriptional regulator [Thermodesulfovibrionaceae bacterium]
MLVITTMTNTKDKILKSALKLFSQKGYLATTTKEIAKEAQVAEVTLFRYFSSKEKLFVEVLKNQSFLPTLKELIPKIEKLNYKEALKTVAKYYLELLKRKKDLIRIMHMELFQYPMEIKSIHSKLIHDVAQTFAIYLEGEKRKGVLKEINTKYAAIAFFGLLFNLFMKKELLRRKFDVKKALETYIEIFYEGTRRRA